MFFPLQFIYLIVFLLLFFIFSYPYEILFNRRPNYNELHVFGSLCFPWLKPYTAHKLEPKSSPCVFLGYSLNQSAYFCMDIETQKIYTSRHVHFIKSEFPLISHPLFLPLIGILSHLWFSLLCLCHLLSNDLRLVRLCWLHCT